MSTILFMVSLALLLSVGFVATYLWASSNGQFDDLETPALRILKDDLLLPKKERETNEPAIR
jgi:cbb3-type cytochrome oxidase maturation protein